MGQLRYLPPEDDEEPPKVPLPSSSAATEFPTPAEAASLTSSPIASSSAPDPDEPLRQILNPWPPTRISHDRLQQVQTTIREQGRSIVRQIIDDSVIQATSFVSRRSGRPEEARIRRGGQRPRRSAEYVEGMQTGLFGFGFGGLDGRGPLAGLRDEDERDRNSAQVDPGMEAAAHAIGVEPERLAEDISAIVRPLLVGGQHTMARLQRREQNRQAARRRALERLENDTDMISVHEFLRETSMFDTSDRSASPDTITNTPSMLGTAGRRANSISSTAEMLDFMGIATGGDGETRSLETSVPSTTTPAYRRSRNWMSSRELLRGIMNPASAPPAQQPDHQIGDGQYNFQHIVDEIRRIGDSEDLHYDLRNSLIFGSTGPHPRTLTPVSRGSPSSSTPIDPSLTSRGRRVLERQQEREQGTTQPPAPRIQSRPRVVPNPRDFHDTLSLLRDSLRLSIRLDPSNTGTTLGGLTVGPTGAGLGTSDSHLSALTHLQSRLNALTEQFRQIGSDTIRRHAGSSLISSINNASAASLTATAGTPGRRLPPPANFAPGESMTINDLRLRAHYVTPLSTRPSLSDLDPSIPVPTPHPRRSLRRPIAPGTQARLARIDALLRVDYERLAHEFAELPITNRDEPLTESNSYDLDALPELPESAEQYYLEELERIERTAQRRGTGRSGLRNSELARPDATSFFALLPEFEANEIVRGGNPYSTTTEDGRSGTRGGAQEVYDSLFTAEDLNENGGYSEDRLLRRICLNEERERIMRRVPVGNLGRDGGVDTGAFNGKIVGSSGGELFGGW